jgi:predicted ATPase/class 3 adenylate cyclase
MQDVRRKSPVGTVTFLFSDIEGSTGLVQSLGADWPGVLERHRAIARSAFDRHAGVEQGTEGDSFFVAFADAPAAIAAAAEIQRGLAAENWPGDSSLRIRIGLHTGEGRLSGDGYVGLDVHRAARIAAAGYGGQVLLSESTRVLVERDLPDRVSLRDLGEHALKDLPRAEHIYQLVFEDLGNDFPALGSIGGRGNLPEPLTSFIGRERELEEVLQLLRTSRLVTLVGPGGTGKTRIAIEAARRAARDFRDGAWFVGLADVSDPGQVPSSISTSVGVLEVGGKGPEAVLVDHFRPRQNLLILDNFEHVVEAAPIVTTLLSGATELTVAATSQTPLRVSGEQLYPVPPLSLPLDGGAAEDSDAFRLFVDRAARARPDFADSPASEAAIAEICRRLDGLPLAIELAAARVRLLSVEDILARLDSRLALLSAGPADAPARLRTLRGAIAWSHELLGPAETILFRRLAVFSGGAPLGAIEDVCADASLSDVLSALDELVGHSLITSEVGATGTRIRMLESIREFALERLRDSNEESVFRGRHAAWYVDQLEALVAAWRLDSAAGRSYEPDADNIRAALDWAETSGDSELGLRICGVAWRLWQEVGSLREGYQRTAALLDQAPVKDDALVRMRAIEGAAGMAYYLGDGPSALALYRERLSLARQHAGPAEIANALFDLSFALSRVPDQEGALGAMMDAQARYAEIGDADGVARCRWFQSSLALMQGRVADARAILDEVAPIFREHADYNYLGQALGSFALSELMVGRFEEADRAFTETLRFGLGRTSLVGLIIGVGSWARIRRLTGHAEQAALMSGAFEGLSATYGIPMPPQLVAMLDRIDATLNIPDELEPAVRKRLLDEGRRMSVEELLEYGRSSLT